MEKMLHVLYYSCVSNSYHASTLQQSHLSKTALYLCIVVLHYSRIRVFAVVSCINPTSVSKHTVLMVLQRGLDYILIYRPSALRTCLSCLQSPVEHVGEVLFVRKYRICRSLLRPLFDS